MAHVWILSAAIFLPAAGALLLAFFPRENAEAIKRTAFVFTLAVFLLTLYMALPAPGGVENSGQFSFDADAVSTMQNTFALEWIPSFDIYYYLGMDGISFPLVLLTSFISLLAMGASWNIEKNVKAYCMLFLLLETGMIGVFLALDFFLFFVFWEVMLLPMYFLIGVWGGPRKEYAAIKFFLYTMFGGVLMLIAILMLYFNSDLRTLSDQQLADVHHSASPEEAAKWRKGVPGLEDKPGIKQNTFNLLALQQMGQHTDVFNEKWLGKSVQWWAFVLLFIGFLIKVPSVPLHTWLPDAHVEAPTPVSMILAGVLLKMGGYGIIRICYPICPQAGYDLAWIVCTVGVVSMVYGAFAAMAQKDFKRLVAYSSVSHMGYVVLGLGVWSARAGTEFVGDYWSMGVSGAMFQMIAHGISSAGMFFLVGVIYDRVHHRDLDQFGGLFARMPAYSGLAVVIFFAGLGLPGLCGFIGEVLILFSVWKFSIALAVISATVVILTAAYILWTIQRVYLGPEYKGPHAEALVPITPREMSIAVPLVILAILFGVFPKLVLNYVTPTVEAQVEDLADWAKENRNPVRTTANTKAKPQATIARSHSQPQRRVPSQAPGNEPQTERLTQP